MHKHSIHSYTQNFNSNNKNKCYKYISIIESNNLFFVVVVFPLSFRFDISLTKLFPLTNLIYCLTQNVLAIVLKILRGKTFIKCIFFSNF